MPVSTEDPKQNPLNAIVSSGLKATTPGSLISASLNLHPDAFSPSGEATAKLQGGDELRIRQRGNDVYAEILDRGIVVDSEPSGRFTLADGKTMITESGKVVGGTSLQRESWLMFALLTDWPSTQT
jgi:hypothetical protein